MNIRESRVQQIQYTSFGLWRDTSGSTDWLAGNEGDLTQVVLDPLSEYTSFAGSSIAYTFSFNVGTIIELPARHFVLEAVPEPST